MQFSELIYFTIIKLLPELYGYSLIILLFVNKNFFGISCRNFYKKSTIFSVYISPSKGHLIGNTELN